MRDFFKQGPVPLAIEAIRIVLLGLALMVVALVFDGNYGLMALITGAFAVGVASKYAWWHFRPFKEPPAQPVTRYNR